MPYLVPVRFMPWTSVVRMLRIPLTERKRQRIDYVPERDHDYSREKPEMREVEPEHFVYCSESELRAYEKQLG